MRISVTSQTWNRCAEQYHSLGLLQTHVTDSLAVLERLGRSGRRGELDVLDTKVIQTMMCCKRISGMYLKRGRRGDSRLGDLHLGLQVEKGIGELLTLSEGGFDDLQVDTECGGVPWR